MRNFNKVVLGNGSVLCSVTGERTEVADPASVASFPPFMVTLLSLSPVFSLCNPSFALAMKMIY